MYLACILFALVQHTIATLSSTCFAAATRASASARIAAASVMAAMRVDSSLAALARACAMRSKQMSGLVAGPTDATKVGQLP